MTKGPQVIEKPSEEQKSPLEAALDRYKKMRNKQPTKKQLLESVGDILEESARELLIVRMGVQQEMYQRMALDNVVMSVFVKHLNLTPEKVSEMHTEWIADRKAQIEAEKKEEKNDATPS